MEENNTLISYCGLYCGACPSFKKGRCPGCARNEKASWCKVRKCNIAKGIRSCADCEEYPNTNDCPRFNNFVAKAFGVVFNTDRRKGIAFIKYEGYELYAKNMATLNRVGLKRRG
ncbi:MAG: DUF3795 domain-containing protein [Bacteroidia bacterium]|nr:DUF3795 domain-containing protein [Bacteroidia bacterium]